MLAKVVAGTETRDVYRCLQCLKRWASPQKYERVIDRSATREPQPLRQARASACCTCDTSFPQVPRIRSLRRLFVFAGGTASQAVEEDRDVDPHDRRHADRSADPFVTVYETVTRICVLPTSVSASASARRVVGLRRVCSEASLSVVEPESSAFGEHAVPAGTRLSNQSQGMRTQPTSPCRFFASPTAISSASGPSSCAPSGNCRSCSSSMT